MLREEKGITLVALIITIVVLIILAAVTIMSVTKDGFIGTAINGTQNFQNAQYYENSVIDDVYQRFTSAVSNIESTQKYYESKAAEQNSGS